MMNYRSTNLVILNGRLGQDSQVKQIAENRFMVTFSIATSSSVRAGDGSWTHPTLWHSCVLFGSRADRLADRLLKGALVSVQGSISYRDVEQEGRKVRYTDILVDDVQILQDAQKEPAPKQQVEQLQQAQQQTAMPPAPPVDPAEDCPDF